MKFSGLRQWIEDHPARAGTLAGWYQQASGALAALVVVPLVMRNLTDSDAGLWFSFQSVLAILNLTDFGLSFVVARQISYSLHARLVGAEKAPQDFILTREGWHGVSDVYQISRRLFRWIGLAALVVLLALYHLVLPMGKLLANASSNTTIAWYLLGMATLLSIQAKPHFALLEGLGRVYLTRFLVGTCQLLTGFGVVWIVFMGGGLGAMASAVMAVSLLQYGAAKYLVHYVAGGRIAAAGPPPTSLFRKLFKVAWPMGILNLSAFLFSSMQVPVLGFLLGPKAVPGFYLAQRIGQMLNQGVMQIVGPQLPLFTQALARGEHALAGERMQRTIWAVTGLALAANLFFLFGSPILVGLWVGQNRYISLPTLQIMTIDYFLMTASVVWAQFVLASGSNPFVWTTLLAGLLTFSLCAWWAPLGATGVALASLLAGLCTNYWFTTWKGIDLQASLKRKGREQTLAFCQS